MLQVIEQTRDEKIAMYMKLTKRELAEMLVNCNEALTARSQQWQSVPEPQTARPITTTVFVPNFSLANT